MIRGALFITLLLLIATIPVVPQADLSSNADNWGTRLPAYYVNADNKLGPWDGTLTHPYKNLTWAISNGTQGGYIYVYSGTYNEQVTLNKKFYVIGNGSATTIVDGGNSKTTMNVTASNCWIFGLTLRGGGSISNNKDSGLKILASYTKVENCSVSNNLYNGLYTGSSNIYIYNCTFKSNNRGINLQNPNYVYIKNCKFEANSVYGIYNSVNRNTFISNCSFNNTNTALRLFDGDWTNVTTSTFSNNSLGLYLMATDHATIKNNTFLYNNYDMTISNSFDDKISYNRFLHCGYTCVKSESSSHNNFINNNTFQDGSIGMLMTADSNSFVCDNSFDSGWGAMIYLDNAKYMNVTRNKGGASFNGFYIYRSHSNIFLNNEFTNTRWPFEIEANPNAVDSYSNIFTNNKVTGADMGFWIKGSEKDRVENNTMVSCDKGVLMNGTNRTTVCKNTFIDTMSLCIELENSKCVGNHFYHNNMLGCGPFKDLKQARDNGTNSIWNTSTEGNFWSYWRTPDSDNNGIVDVSYVVGGTGDSKDQFPLTHPFGGPRITNLDINTSFTDQLYSNLYAAIDANTTQASLTWSLRTDAPWLGLSGTYLNGTPSWVNTGPYWVNVSVSDGFYTDFTNFTLDVITLVEEMTINSTGLPLTWTEDVASWHAFALSNPKAGDSLTWNMTSDAGFLLMSATGNLSGTPGNGDVGLHWVNVTVTEPVRGSEHQNLTLTVLNTNDPPQISAGTPPPATQDVLYWFVLTATDPDPTGDVLSWTMTTNATFLSMKSGNVSGVPGNEDVGPHWVNVSVNDDHGATSMRNMTLTVKDVNDPPVAIEPNVKISILEDSVDTATVLSSLFEDMDGDALTFKASKGVSISTRVLDNEHLELTPAANWNGLETLVVYANDTHSQASVTLNVTVLPVNDAPADAQISILEDSYVEGGPQRVGGSATDADLPYGDILIYSWYANSTKIGSGPELNMSLKAGHYRITLNVSDLQKAWATTSVEMIVLHKTTNITPDDDVDDDVDDDIVDDDVQDDDAKPGDDNKTSGLDMRLVWVGLAAVVVTVVILLAVMVYSRKRRAGKEEEEPEEEKGEVLPEPVKTPAPSRGKDAPQEVFVPRRKRESRPAPIPKVRTAPVTRPRAPLEDALIADRPEELVPGPEQGAPALESSPEETGLTEDLPKGPIDELVSQGPAPEAAPAPVEQPADPKVSEKKELEDIFGDL